MFPEQTGTLVVDGASYLLTLRPGENARLTFSGTAGPRLGLASTGATIGVFGVTILNPDGSTLASTTMSGNPAVLTTAPLSASGTYSVFINPSGFYSGNVTLTLSTEVTSNIVVNGPPYPVSVTRKGQNQRLSFSGTAGQNVSVAFTGATLGGGFGWATAAILKPDGSALTGSANMSSCCPVIVAPPLPTNGTYAVFINSSLNTGNVTVTLSQEVNGGSITINGPGTMVTTRVGQKARATFDGTAGQQVTVHVTGNTESWSWVSLLKPDGSQMTYTYWYTGAFNLPAQTLPTSGTYTIYVNPKDFNAGSMTLSVTSP